MLRFKLQSANMSIFKYVCINSATAERTNRLTADLRKGEKEERARDYTESSHFRYAEGSGRGQRLQQCSWTFNIKSYTTETQTETYCVSKQMATLWVWTRVSDLLHSIYHIWSVDGAKKQFLKDCTLCVYIQILAYIFFYILPSNGVSKIFWKFLIIKDIKLVKMGSIDIYKVSKDFK